MKRLLVMIIILFCLFTTENVMAEEKNEEIEIPNSVLNIAKENTYSNSMTDLPYLQPSPLAKELIESAEMIIENPELIRMLNESNINHSKLSLGFRASIFLGEWPLSYESDGTEINWEYKRINTNYYDNRGGATQQMITYNQEQQQKVSGGLTASIPESEAVTKMMMLKAAEQTNLPLSFETIIGKGTKKNHTYHIPSKKVGYLYSHVPAAYEKGNVTYGEVYLTFKGGKRKIEFKNVTNQGVSAWIPIRDHLSFTFITQ